MWKPACYSTRIGQETQDHTYKTVSTSEKKMSPRCYQSLCPIHCLGILPDPSVMMMDSFFIGRTLATGFGALVFCYRHNNFLSTAGNSKVLSRKTHDQRGPQRGSEYLLSGRWLWRNPWRPGKLEQPSLVPLLWVPSPTLAVPLMTGLKPVIIQKDQHYQSALLTVHRVAGPLSLKKMRSLLSSWAFSEV